MRHIQILIFILIGLSLGGCYRVIETKDGVIPKDLRKKISQYTGDYLLQSADDRARLLLDDQFRLQLTLPASIDSHCFTSLQAAEKIELNHKGEQTEIRAIFPVRSTVCGEAYLGREVHFIVQLKQSNINYTIAIHNGFALQDACEYYIPQTIVPNLFVHEDLDLKYYPEKFQEGEWTYELVYPGQSNLMRRCRKAMLPSFRKFGLKKATN
jgi:hypothetical protein